MANTFVADLQSGCDFAFALAEKFLSICPDEIWNTIFGGWPVAHQFYHGLSTVPFFVGDLVKELPDNPCPESGNLTTREPGALPAKAQAAAYLADLKATMQALFAGLSDADLNKKNATVSSALGKDMTNGAVLGLLASHLLYHLGSCDAALREQGLEGAF
ncbi:MAG: DinB family protein [Desulfobulbus sp.]|jgi:uncharacterized damage-inducible protein DinB